jgi:hypothetical protein
LQFQATLALAAPSILRQPPCRVSDAPAAGFLGSGNEKPPPWDRLRSVKLDIL